MKILVLNCGSSSLKYQLFDMDGEKVLSKGLVERIGIPGSRVKHNRGAGDPVIRENDIPDHGAAIKMVLDLLTGPETGVIKSMDEISAAGHRVVHGGEKYAESVLADDSVMRAIDECTYLAPLHNPANLAGIRAMQEALPGIPNAAVFDTAFHQTMPPEAFLYGIPYKYYEKDRVRRYSFHGTSHKFVSSRAAELLGRPIERLKLVTCHVGNGSSITAVDGGRSVDSSLGMGTSPGVIMGTRSGDLDSAVVLHLVEREGSVRRASDIINKESGVLGISGISSDMRDIFAASVEGSERAALTMNMLARSIKKYIAAYAAVMGGADAVVFTAGVGENSDTVRELSLEGLEFMGIKLDKAKNAGIHGSEAEISTPDSPVKVLVIPTNEELMIARDTLGLVKKRPDEKVCSAS
ncbi:MAG: acetate kinase [Synergistaceae bacterium]|jgi:acetate kinase|nr:acetate kinase [Synergistaceae bacterium]